MFHRPRIKNTELQDIVERTIGCQTVRLFLTNITYHSAVAGKAAEDSQHHIEVEAEDDIDFRHTVVALGEARHD